MKKQNKAKQFGKGLLKSEKLGLFIALLAIVVVFSILTDNNFLTWGNIRNIMISSSIVGLVVIGECALIITAGVDLSPGSVAAFAGVMCAMLLSSGVPFILAIILTLMGGMVIGYINATLINVFKMEPFIATLATMSVFRGLTQIICDGKAVFVTNKYFLKMGTERVFGLPIPAIICAVFFILGIVILSRTRFGRSVYMVGGNKNAARLAGINEKKVKYIIYTATSALAALGGIIQAARMSSGQPTGSVGLEFDAVTAVILGGVAMLGGSGTLSGALIGLIILQGFNNGLAMMSVPSFWQTVSRGMLLIVALAFDYIRRTRKINKEKKLAQELQAAN